MNVHVFNFALLGGWLLATAGAIVINVGAGICFGGLLLLALTLFAARVGGGVFDSAKKTDGTA
jgi:hypothetical protein